MGTDRKHQYEADDLRQRVESEQHLRAEAFTDESRRQRSEGKADAEGGGDLALAAALLAGFGLFKCNFADGEGKHRFGDTEKRERAKEYDRRLNKKMRRCRDHDGYRRCRDDQHSRANVARHHAGGEIGANPANAVDHQRHARRSDRIAMIFHEKWRQHGRAGGAGDLENSGQRIELQGFNFHGGASKWSSQRVYTRWLSGFPLWTARNELDRTAAFERGAAPRS